MIPPNSTPDTRFTSALLLAAGSGSRMQGTTTDKALEVLGGLPVICHSVRAFVDSECVQHFTIVYRDEAQRVHLETALHSVDLNGQTIDWIQGGNRRQDSTYNALLQQSKDVTHVFIHDSARPLITIEAIKALHAAALRDQAAVLAHPATDTIKRIPEPQKLEQALLEDLNRSQLWAVETPQAFSLELILKAHEHVKEARLHITDDTAAISALGLGTTLVPNDTPNIKITHPHDLHYAAWLLKQKS